MAWSWLGKILWCEPMMTSIWHRILLGELWWVRNCQFSPENVHWNNCTYPSMWSYEKNFFGIEKPYSKEESSWANKTILFHDGNRYIWKTVFICDQAALWMVQSVRLSVRPSARDTFFTMFLSSYHHEIFRSYYHWQKWCPCERSRFEVKGQGHRDHDPT